MSESGDRRAIPAKSPSRRASARQVIPPVAVVAAAVEPVELWTTPVSPEPSTLERALTSVADVATESSAPAELPPEPFFLPSIAEMAAESPAVEPEVEVSASPVSAGLTSIPPIPPSHEVIPMISLTPSTPFKGYEDLTAFGKANLAAFIQANTVFAKGFEEISKEVFGLAQASFESAQTATKAILAARTLKDMVALNADFTKAQVETLMANSTRLGELTVKLATETVAPIAARVSQTVDATTSTPV